MSRWTKNLVYFAYRALIKSSEFNSNFSLIRAFFDTLEADFDAYAEAVAAVLGNCIINGATVTAKGGMTVGIGDGISFAGGRSVVLAGADYTVPTPASGSCIVAAVFDSSLETPGIIFLQGDPATPTTPPELTEYQTIIFSASVAAGQSTIDQSAIDYSLRVDAASLGAEIDAARISSLYGAFATLDARLENAEGIPVNKNGVSSGQTIKGGTGSGENLTLQSTAHATKGKIILGSQSAYDEVNARLGIGTTSPTEKFEIVGNIKAVVSGGYTSYTGRSYSDTNWHSSRFGFHRYRGSSTIPQIVQNGDRIGYFDFFGFDGSTDQRVGMFEAAVDAVPSAGIVPGRFTISTADSGGVNRSRIVAYSNDDVIMATNSGKVGVGVASPVCKLDIDGPIRCKSYTVATVPAASLGTGMIIYVSNESGGAVLAFSDGTNWRRVTDRAIIS